MPIEFSASTVLLTLFTGAVSGLASYFGAYSKVKAEVRAATEDLHLTIQNLTATTRAVELEKAAIAAHSALEADRRKCIYAIATAIQTLIHSMCWLAWDAKMRGVATSDACRMYNSEAHSLLPELFSQLAVLRILDSDFHQRTYVYASKLTELDVEFGSAILLSEHDPAAGAKRLAQLFPTSSELQFEIDALFGGNLQTNLPNEAAKVHSAQAA